MSWTSIWAHLVFSTKNNEPLLYKEIRTQVFDHIKEHAASKGIWLEAVNGHADHVHCLFHLDKDQCVNKIVQLIKGESSYWINRQKLTSSIFRWQDDYWALGINKHHLLHTKTYIQNQEVHHLEKTLQEEVKELFDHDLLIFNKK